MYYNVIHVAIARILLFIYNNMLSKDDFSYVPLENYLPTLGKKIKKAYIRDFGIEPPTHKHPISGSGQKMSPCYYPKPWLKSQLGL